MTAKKILSLKAKDIMIKRVGKVSRDEVVIKAIKKLFVMNVGALVVVDKDDHIVGIFTERDILRRIIPKKFNVDKVRVSKVMTEDPVTVEKETSVVEVFKAMRSMNCRHTPVVEDGKIVGIISIKDIAKACMDLVLKSK